ncbi:MAG: hypothetical protein KKG64_04895 [Firmicutes bacterium]|nr:hypothetical protein [Bacillota bacterium]
MPRKIIIETDEMNDECKEEFKEPFRHEFREGFRRMRDHGPFGNEKVIKKHVHMQIETEVKLFTDKSEMVTYVNQLTNILNVEIFKIEEQLYKVLVTRRKKLEGCCEEHQEEKE